MDATGANSSNAAAAGQPLLSDREFRIFSGLVYELCGIKLSPIKKTMLSVRLHKRLVALGIPTFKAYLEFVLSEAGQRDEVLHLIDVVSTNKTDFFREPDHFTYLSAKVLPEFATGRRYTSQRRLTIWSAGCSSGEEPYTLAMVVNEFVEQHPWLDFVVVGTDVCTRMLEMAQSAIYANDRVTPIPKPYLHKYFMQGRGERKDFHRVVPELRRKVVLHRLNFKDSEFHLDYQMDVIFCRNVIIYFDRPTQRELLAKLHRQLVPGGYLFIGHSETMEGMDRQFQRMAPTVYRCHK